MHPSRRILQRTVPRADDEGGVPSEGTRGSGPSPPPHRPPGQSGAFLKALTDDDSILARFLFRGGGGRDGDGGGSWLTRSFRDGDAMPSVGSTDAAFCALALEPREQRSERIIMVFEAYAIFGVLFLGAVWIIYEWASPKGGFSDADGIHPAVARAFECIMASALGCNVIMALYGAIWWIHSIKNCSSSNEDFAIEVMKPLAFLHNLLFSNTWLVTLGLLLGIYTNLRPNSTETIVIIVIVWAITERGRFICLQLFWSTIPLKIYHLPLAGKLSFPPYWRKRGREDLRARAKLRAQELTERARHERKRLDPAFEARGGDAGPMGALLSEAATNLGMTDGDVSNFEARLKKDWFFEVDHLKGWSVECLSGYMPLRLAKEVHRLVEFKHSDQESCDF